MPRIVVEAMDKVSVVNALMLLYEEHGTPVTPVSIALALGRVQYVTTISAWLNEMARDGTVEREVAGGVEVFKPK